MEQKKEKKSIKIWWEERKAKAKDFCKRHPDAVLCTIGGIASLLGGILKIWSNKTEYEDNVYVTLDDGDIYKVPSKKMKTVKKKPSSHR